MTVTHDLRRDRHAARRWRVHLGLIVFGGGALLVVILRTQLAVHVVAGLCFAGLVAVHLTQRRRTLKALVPDLGRPGRWRTARGRLALSDAVLVFLAANVVASGVIDWSAHATVMLSPRRLTGIPLPSLNWHTTASLALVVYLVVHVASRRARLRHSHIR